MTSLPLEGLPRAQYHDENASLVTDWGPWFVSPWKKVLSFLFSVKDVKHFAEKNGKRVIYPQERTIFWLKLCIFSGFEHGSPSSVSKIPTKKMRSIKVLLQNLAIPNIFFILKLFPWVFPSVFFSKKHRTPLNPPTGQDAIVCCVPQSWEVKPFGRPAFGIGGFV